MKSNSCVFLIFVVGMLSLVNFVSADQSFFDMLMQMNGCDVMSSGSPGWEMEFCISDNNIWMQCDPGDECWTWVDCVDNEVGWGLPEFIFLDMMESSTCGAYGGESSTIRLPAGQGLDIETGDILVYTDPAVNFYYMSTGRQLYTPGGDYLYRWDLPSTEVCPTYYDGIEGAYNQTPTSNGVWELQSGGETGFCIYNPDTELSHAYQYIYFEGGYFDFEEVSVCGDTANESCLAPPCTVNWTCNGYASCLVNDTQICNDVIDLNDCSIAYSGDYSEFEVNVCDYCTPSWNCTTYDECISPIDSVPCIAVNDDNSCYALTSLASDNYTGDFSGFVEADCFYPNDGGSAQLAQLLSQKQQEEIETLEPNKGIVIVPEDTSEGKVTSWFRNTWNKIKMWWQNLFK